eukprot:CAMPEP_0194028096 /NCGR_PEP_ID=MMETSP0009_2-20130614/2122_1 /TAXON_ID=210454 /ORGANISM="Grammatophora oceanica, Strain CCMP 410" /LENGTH=173 /DNA_ID=CAMNT_0038667363 /DNA_START=57 /DNA_END=575 /DNA_ORIENTATION=-
MKVSAGALLGASLLLGFEAAQAFQVRPAVSVSNRLSSTSRLSASFTDVSTDTLGIDEAFIHFPHKDIDGPSVVNLCLDAMAENNKPIKNAGLEVCWNFSSDRCRAAQGGSFEHFVDFAANPVFGVMIEAQKYEVLNVGSIIAGTQTRGPMQTVLTDVYPAGADAETKPRTFLW